MTTNGSVQPPRIATWLLKALGVSPANESLLGDLVEEYQCRRSAWWYWRQVLTAIVVSVVQGLRSHKLLVLRAIAIGWIVNEFTALMAVRALFGGNLQFRTLQWGYSLPTTSLYFLAFCVSAAVSGWVVARFHARPGAPIVLTYIAVTLLVVALTLPWDYQMVTRDVFLSLLPFQLAYGFFGLPLSILFGARLAARRRGNLA